MIWKSLYARQPEQAVTMAMEASDVSPFDMPSGSPKPKRGVIISIIKNKGLTIPG
jgi:hypothetical protein